MVRNAITDYLYQGYLKESMDAFKSIVIKNTLLGKFEHPHFLYKGTLYIDSILPTPTRKNPLLPELHPVMDEYLKERREFENGEYYFVGSYLTQVLNACSNITDCYAAFPSCVEQALNTGYFVHFKSERTITDETILELQKKNEKAISWIKQRVLLNMITK